MGSSLITVVWQRLKKAPRPLSIIQGDPSYLRPTDCGSCRMSILFSVLRAWSRVELVKQEWPLCDSSMVCKLVLDSVVAVGERDRFTWTPLRTFAPIESSTPALTVPGRIRWAEWLRDAQITLLCAVRIADALTRDALRQKHGSRGKCCWCEENVISYSDRLEIEDPPIIN